MPLLFLGFLVPGLVYGFVTGYAIGRFVGFVYNRGSGRLD